MERGEIVKTDFPEAAPGFEKSSVVAHLEAVAAQLAALEARARALEVELDAVRATGATRPEGGPPPTPTPPAKPAPPPTPVEEVPADSGDPVAARLVATELVLDGVERDLIIERIEVEYGIGDAAALVDEVIARTT